MIETVLLIIAGFAAGFVDAIAGGGGMIGLPAVLAMGLPPTSALGTNKAIGIATACASSFRYLISGNVDVKKVLPWALCAAFCSFLGALVVTNTRQDFLRPLILVLLVSFGLFSLTRRNFGLDDGSKKSPKTFWIFPAVGLVGFYDGFFGPGTGTFLMMCFVLLMGQSLLKASANSRVVNFATNLGAIWLFGVEGHIDIRLVGPAAIASFLGGLCGASWAIAKGSKAVRRVFIVVTWLLIAKVAWDMIVGGTS